MKRFVDLRLRLLRASPDRGIALVTVIAITAVLGILVVSAIAVSLGGLRKAKNSQDWNGALAAAYAGVEDYQGQLTNDRSYGRYGNPASPFTGHGPVLPPKMNSALSVGPSGSWAKVPGSEGLAEFRYEVDNSQLFSNGVLRLRSTGRVGVETRTVVVDLKQKGFGDFVYFTDFETTDPSVTNPPKDEWGRVIDCARYADARPPHRVERDYRCPEIAFGYGDVLDGPVHSNDRMLMECDVVFRKAVTTAYVPPPRGKAYKQGTRGVTGCTPTFEDPLSPMSGTRFDLPKTNSEMRKEVRYDLGDEVPVPGCLYSGPTRIIFRDDGTMRVKSPWTKKVQVSATGGRDNAACGAPGRGPGQLGHWDGALVPVPDNNVIYVQNVPTVPSDPNYSSFDTRASDGHNHSVCKGDEPVNPVGYPVSGETVQDAKSYQCRNGDVFVKGNLKGKVTVAAENRVYIVDDIQYVDGQRDLLGLVGQNAVVVAAPGKWNGRTWERLDGGCGKDRYVDASILSVAHTFMVQNTHVMLCSGGSLYVKGSIAQKFRGIVFTEWRDGASGYYKDYRYDPRLRQTSPPRFLAPTQITYGVSSWAEVDPVMKADGSYA